ncbi:nucleotide-binding alpha-beta plait domain-containing protein [Tanacetum coccineum]
MGHRHSNEDEVPNISTLIFVTNFPDQFYAKDLWKGCNQYGTVVDAFIPNRRSKSGKRFGFVHFIKIFDVDHLVDILYTIWVQRFKLHANVARFQRSPLKNSNTQFINKVGKKSVPDVVHKDSGVYGYSNSYAHAVKIGSQSQNVEEENKPKIVLDEMCVNQQNYSTSLMGKVKEFSSLTNLKVVLDNEGKVLCVRAKEISGWIPDFVEDDEGESDSDDEIRDEGLHDENVDKHKYATVEGESDVEEVAETIFENEQS